MKSSPFARSFELLKLATKVGYHELLSGDLPSRIAQAKAITKSLSELKGTAMKAGQLLSLELDDYFPPEAIEILSALQKDAQAHPTAEMKGILATELGREKLARVSDFSESPVAAASIGQLHRAKFDGRPVAIKIQYPGVGESIDSDLKILEKLATALCSLTGRSMRLEPLFDEFREVLRNEVSYLRERDFLERYGNKLRALSAEGPYRYEAPVAIAEATTDKVLTMSWVEGVDLREWLKTEPSRAHREHVAHAILNLFEHEFYRWGLVQTDPNFANFKVRIENNLPTLVALDFGATKEYTPEFIAQYVQLLRALDRGATDELLAQAMRFGILDARESAAVQAIFVELMRTAAEPFQSTDDHFDFSDKSYAERTRDITTKFARAVRYTPAPYKIVFLHRKLGGIFVMLKRLGVRIDVKPYWQQMLRLELQNSSL